MLSANDLVLAGHGLEQVDNAASTAPNGTENYTSREADVSLGQREIRELAAQDHRHWT